MEILAALRDLRVTGDHRSLIAGTSERRDRIGDCITDHRWSIPNPFKIKFTLSFGCLLFILSCLYQSLESPRETPEVQMSNYYSRQSATRLSVWMCQCVNVSMCECVNVWMCECLDVWLCKCVNVSMCQCVNAEICSFCWNLLEFTLIQVIQNS